MSTTGANVTKSTFLEFYGLYSKSLIEKERVVAAEKALKRRIKASGLDLKELENSYKLAQQDRDTRDAAFDTRRLYMAWLDKPLGSQGELDLSTGSGESADDIAAAEKHALSEAYRSGYVSGKTGAGMAFCPYDAGTEAHQQYSLGVTVGEEIYKTAHPVKVKKDAHALVGVVKRGRGRPRKDGAADAINLNVGDSSVQVINFPTGFSPAAPATA